mmetsp:Transcript_1822/g.2636  ORF Transcript_1822/g.2636 Transcript_1822/m.2636 type:complete len:592 (+) Transcript_1822:105-1880(+)
MEQLKFLSCCLSRSMSNMSEEPINKDDASGIPLPMNNLVTPLLTDLYQLTMAYGYWKNGKHNDQAVFELFFRKNPFKGSFTIFCGIDQVIPFVHHFKFTESDISYLKSTPGLQHCEEEFFTYLSNLDCSEVQLQALDQGCIAFPRVPLIVVSGPLVVCQLLETTLLNLVNFPSLLATNAARMVVAARGQHSTIKIHNRVPACVEFGLRRAQGPDGGFSASKYCLVGGFVGTSNVLAGKLLGVAISGTQAHAFVQSYTSLDEVKDMRLKIKSPEGSSSGNGISSGSSNAVEGSTVELLQLVLKYRQKLGGDWLKTNDGELAAFIAYAIGFPHAFLALIDTYNTIKSGLKNFILVSLALHECGYQSRGIRLDSGDLAALSQECRKMFEEIAEKYNLPSFLDFAIVASNDINEATLLELNSKGHAITVFGIGTNLVTCQAQPALGCVFKLVQLNGKPRIKLSSDKVKVLIPGQKRAFRLFNAEGTPEMDLMVEIREDIPKAGVEYTCYNPFTDDAPLKFTPARVEELLHTVWNKKDGACRKILSLEEAQANVFQQIKSLNPEMLRPSDPLMIQVKTSKKLHDDLHELWVSNKSL